MKILFVALSLVLVAGMTGSAYEYAGQAWCCDSVHYYINPADPTNSCGTQPAMPGWFQTLVLNAAASWNAQGTQFQLLYVDTTSIGCEPYASNPNICAGIKDGQNTVSMATNCNWLDNNILAFATWWYWLPGNGDSSCCIFEADICFNDSVTWFNDQGTCSGSCYDLQSVATHEFGHWIAANHEPDDAVLGYRPVMFPSFNFCEIRRNLTADDIALLNWAYDLAGVIDVNWRCDLAHNHPDPLGAYPPPPPHSLCGQGGCPPGPPFCDSTIVDSCLLICPKSDVVFTVTLRDSCGNPICDPAGTGRNVWLDFSECPSVVPCPNEEPDWPRVFPDSCDPVTGTAYFTVDASSLDCTVCEAALFVDSLFCRLVPARFLDNNGDGCVTDADYVGGRACDDFNCNFASDVGDSLIFAAHKGHCCGGLCPPGPPFCDSTIVDSCLLICPKSDVVFTVTLRDSCGNPVCDQAGIGNVWLDFSECPAVVPCPNEEPNWPLVFPDSCNPATGQAFFSVDASTLDCGVLCEAVLYVNGVLCQRIPAHFLDNNGDGCVTDPDFLGGRPCDDFNCNGITDVGDSLIFAAHKGHCCGGQCPPGPPFCDSTSFDPCLLVCPASDAVFRVTVKDSCGNPVCNQVGVVPAVWLDMSNCPAVPCPDEEPDWPLVMPDSCDTATGVHYFTVDAGATDCVDCPVTIVVNGQPCAQVPVRFLDINGDLCVTPDDGGIVGALCTDYNCDGIIDIQDSTVFDAHLKHCCPGIQPPCCVGSVGNVNCDPLDQVDVADLTTLIDHLFITFTPLCCRAEANINGDPQCQVDVADLTALIDHLFITFKPLPQCGSCP